MTNNKKNNIKDSLLKDSIITGIVSSIIFTFLIQPVFGIVWSYINQSGLQLYSTFSNHLYSAAALGYRNDAERIFLASFAGIISGITITIAMFFLGESGITKVTESFRSNEFHSFITSKVGIWVSRLVRLALVIYFAQFAIKLTYAAIVVYATTELNASFQQKINALRPYITEIEQEKLVSDWALMKNQNDYYQINAQLDIYGSANGIKLPSTLWPDVLWSSTTWP